VGGESIRFSVQTPPVTDPAEWLDLARRVEDLGFWALHVADHPGVTLDPFAALTAAAAVTTTLHLGTYVLNAGIRDPLSIAIGATTVDALSGGRLVLGMGAGHVPAEWTSLDRSFPPARARVERLRETIEVVDALWAGGVVTYQGEHVRARDARIETPRPVQPGLPLLVGGNGERLLRLAGASASWASLTGLGRTLEDGHHHEVDWSAAAIDARVDVVRDAARGTGNQPVLDALVQWVEITYDRDEAAERLAGRVPGLVPPDALAAPYALIGTVDDLAEELVRHRERWGFTSYVVRVEAVDAIAALMQRLEP